MSGPDVSRYVIGIDLGTGGVKVALATARGEILGNEAEQTATLLLPGGGAEQDPDDWWRAIVTATRRLSAATAAPASATAPSSDSSATLFKFQDYLSKCSSFGLL